MKKITAEVARYIARFVDNGFIGKTKTTARYNFENRYYYVTTNEVDDVAIVKVFVDENLQFKSIEYSCKEYSGGVMPVTMERIINYLTTA